MKGEPNEIDRNHSISDTALQRARQLATLYNVVVRPARDGGGYLGTCAEFQVSVHQATVEACYRSVQDAIFVALGLYIEAGETPPAPMEFHRRTEQVNLRLSVEEKRLLQTASDSRGFESLSEFIRRAAFEVAAGCSDIAKRVARPSPSSGQ